ncbi:MAG: DUF1622 domain-containing protein [Cyanobacteria bacterium]|nr:DUF1622 domain-containing protein [Cyanobacteriota bacterium]
MTPAEIVAQLLVPLATATRRLLEYLSVLTVLAGLVATAGGALASFNRRLLRRPSNQARLSFGSWLALALEFQLGADIVSTTISPSGQQHLIQLAVVAVIRTFLNVFLAREISAEEVQERHAILGQGAAFYASSEQP